MSGDPKNLNPIYIGDRLELFIDDHLVEHNRNVQYELHEPIAREISIKFDKPWEGNLCAYYTILHDDDGLIRLYYRGGNKNLETGEENGYRVCYAESRDGGLTWTKPSLGLFEYKGDTDNNIIWTNAKGCENFTPFKDTKPGVPDDERYKAVGFRLGGHYKLYAFKSSDGIHWTFLRDDPMLTYYHGKFDSQNLIIWNQNIQQYMLFYRDYVDKEKNIGRGIKVALSRDFKHWTHFRWIKYNDPLTQVQMQFYTSCIQKYYRAPHIFIGFPNRFHEFRKGYPDHPISGIFDTLFMTSRDGFTWKRTLEAMMKPGPQKSRWASRNNMVAWGMLETPSHLGSDCPPEISILSSEGYYLKDCCLRRYTFRLDGFMSLKAGLTGGEIITKPLVFQGSNLALNMATSGMGIIKVEIQDVTGLPLQNYKLLECIDIFGDEIKRIVEWKNVGSDLTSLSGKVIRLKFFLRDCHLYSFKFQPQPLPHLPSLFIPILSTSSESSELSTSSESNDKKLSPT